MFSSEELDTPPEKVTKRKTYTQKFRPIWKKRRDLKDWLMAVRFDPRKAYCKFCMGMVQCKLTDLVAHAKTNKHRAAAESYKENDQPLSRFNYRANASISPPPLIDGAVGRVGVKNESMDSDQMNSIAFSENSDPLGWMPHDTIERLTPSEFGDLNSTLMNSSLAAPERDCTSMLFEVLAKKIVSANLTRQQINVLENKVSCLVFTEIQKIYDS